MSARRVWRAAKFILGTVIVLLSGLLAALLGMIVTFIGWELIDPSDPEEGPGSRFGRLIILLMTTPFGFAAGCVLALVVWRAIKRRRPGPA